MDSKLGITALGALLLGLMVGPGGMRADVLELRNGRQLSGTLRGADAETLEFETVEERHLIPRDQVLRLSFGEGSPRAAAAAPPDRATQPLPEPAGHANLARQSANGTLPSPAAAPPSPPPGRNEPGPRKLEISLGTRLRVRISDTIDPRIGAPGDRFAGFLESALSAAGVPLLPAHTRVYGVVSEARTQGPIASRLKLELTELMLGADMVPLVSGTHSVVTDEPAAGAAANTDTAGRPDRIPAGSLLEFPLLQAVTLPAR